MDINSFINNAEKRKTKKKEDPERDIESAFVKYTKEKGYRALKLTILNIKGFPDRTIICPGARVFFIEFKRKNKKPSAPQLKIRKLLELLGFEYYVCDKKGQAESILDNFILK